MFLWALSVFDEHEARTVAMSTMILFELFRVYSCKNTRAFGRLFTNHWLNGAVLLSLVLSLVLMYSPARVAFDLVPLGLGEWWKIILASSSGFFVLELWKVVRGRKKH